jgi:hypothetical protein
MGYAFFVPMLLCAQERAEFNAPLPASDDR